MDFRRLLEQIAETRQRLFAEGHLNENFDRLENYENRFDMEFFAEGALNSYFEATAEVLTKVEQELEKVHLDLLIVLRFLFQIKQYCISVGAANMLTKVDGMVQRMMMSTLEQHSGNIMFRYILVTPTVSQSCMDALRELKLERERFKSKMELYFKMMVWDPPSEIEDDPGYEDEESTDEE